MFVGIRTDFGEASFLDLTHSHDQCETQTIETEIIGNGSLYEVGDVERK